jgi:hypothetical protein
MFKSNKLGSNVGSGRRAGDLWKLEWQQTNLEWTLLVTDVSSGIALVHQLTNFPNALEPIKTVRMAFARFGLPNSIAADHGIEWRESCACFAGADLFGRSQPIPPDADLRQTINALTAAIQCDHISATVRKVNVILACGHAQLVI